MPIPASALTTSGPMLNPARGRGSVRAASEPPHSARRRTISASRSASGTTWASPVPRRHAPTATIPRHREPIADGCVGGLALPDGGYRAASARTRAVASADSARHRAARPAARMPRPARAPRRGVVEASGRGRLGLAAERDPERRGGACPPSRDGATATSRSRGSRRPRSLPGTGYTAPRGAASSAGADTTSVTTSSAVQETARARNWPIRRREVSAAPCATMTASAGSMPGSPGSPGSPASTGSPRSPPSVPPRQPDCRHPFRPTSSVRARPDLAPACETDSRAEFGQPGLERVDEPRHPAVDALDRSPPWPARRRAAAAGRRRRRARRCA